MSTVEAIQARLADTGVVLFPGSPDNPPRIIRDEDILELELRIFPNANEKGLVFDYERQESGKWWVLIVDD